MMAKAETALEKGLRTREIIRKLKKAYPDSHCSLDYRNPFELLVATILSAQCTDERVNKVTPELFRKFPTIEDLSQCDLEELEEVIRSTGFYRNKAKNIKACCQGLMTQHGGRVPQTMEELSHLPGVGRKTANVVLGNAFGVPGLVVDTHVTRLANRMGIARGENAVKLEMDLQPLVPKVDWTLFSHLMISHGRAICMARNPKCKECILSDICKKKIAKS